MKIRKDTNGNKSTKAMVGLFVIVAVILLLTSGLIELNIPTAQDKYTEVVNRDALDLGMVIPLQINLEFIQTTSSGANQGDIDVSVKHKHDINDGYGTSGDYVPDPSLVSPSNFNTKVGNVGDTTTIYAVNGNEFLASDIAFNSTVTSIGAVDFGYAQNNFKVWTTDTTVTPDDVALGKSNHVTVIQVKFDRLVKGTDTILNSYVVTFGVYYSIPNYNAEKSYEAPYTYYVYCPFDDYALAQDIRMTVSGYSDSCVISWKEITSTVRQTWAIEMFGITVFKVIKQVDSVIASNLKYTWQGPRAINTDNSDTWGSHSYLYKVR